MTSIERARNSRKEVGYELYMNIKFVRDITPLGG